MADAAAAPAAASDEPAAEKNRALAAAAAAMSHREADDAKDLTRHGLPPSSDAAKLQAEATLASLGLTHEDVFAFILERVLRERFRQPREDEVARRHDDDEAAAAQAAAALLPPARRETSAKRAESVGRFEALLTEMFAAAADHDKLQRAALALFERLVGGWSERRQNESAADVLLKLHELDLLDDEKIFAWHERRAELPESGRRERQVSRKGLRACVAPLVEWLKRAAAPLATLHTAHASFPGLLLTTPAAPAGVDAGALHERRVALAAFFAAAGLSTSGAAAPAYSGAGAAPPPARLVSQRPMPSLDEARAVAVRLVGADPEKCAAYNVKRKRLYVFSAAAGTLARDLVAPPAAGCPAAPPPTARRRAPTSPSSSSSCSRAVVADAPLVLLDAQLKPLAPTGAATAGSTARWRCSASAHRPRRVVRGGAGGGILGGSRVGARPRAHAPRLAPPRHR